MLYSDGSTDAQYRTGGELFDPEGRRGQGSGAGSSFARSRTPEGRRGQGPRGGWSFVPPRFPEGVHQGESPSCSKRSRIRSAEARASSSDRHFQRTFRRATREAASLRLAATPPSASSKPRSCTRFTERNTERWPGATGQGWAPGGAKYSAWRRRVPILRRHRRGRCSGSSSAPTRRRSIVGSRHRSWCPGVLGAEDPRIPADLHAPRARDLLEGGNSSSCDVWEGPGANHGLMLVRTGPDGEDRAPAHFAEGFHPRLVRWAREALGPG